MTIKRLGLLTSGGDASGMNAAVRAVVRTALDRGVEVYGISEGYAGLIEGGERIKPMSWSSVGGILHRGGTTIGTARSPEFMTREGRLAAARNILASGIDSLIVIGGDGSLQGADVLRGEWSGLVEELVAAGQVSPEAAALHPRLVVVGLFGSIDNDAAGTDMTIGADTALHRITEAIDAISSTASSHKRTFVVEVMGRHCGYLALMSAIATGADWVFIPERPPQTGAWETNMLTALKAGRDAGRRDAIVVVAEGATDAEGQPITSERLQRVLEVQLGGSVRITVLGHVQRGGAPSAFDRNLGTIMGHAAVETLLSGGADKESLAIGMRGNRAERIPLVESVSRSREVNTLLEAREYGKALEMRGSSFNTALQTMGTLLRALPHPPQQGQRRLRLAILHAGAPAPGMNAAVRAAVRVALDQGHVVLGVRGGYRGLAEDDIQAMDWMSVHGWASIGGAELGTNRAIPDGRDFYAIAKTIEKRRIEGLLVVGGWEAYQGAHRLLEERRNFPAFEIPVVALPATIDNNLPGTELSIGADTALNSIVSAVDKIKQSAVAERRCYVVEVMGRRCGYLAAMSGLATGAERVYLHEEGVTLKKMKEDLDDLIRGFSEGKRVGLIIRNEEAQGGDPSPFDRIQATNLARQCVTFLIEQAAEAHPVAAFIGTVAGKLAFHAFEDFPRMVDEVNRRPKVQWWLDLKSVNDSMARSGPNTPRKARERGVETR
ncbi:MAG: 6-phosphofructokinase [Acidobacteria bacterium]|nr:6-phosphofructokinase [Acidobacteriota bacterium]